MKKLIYIFCIALVFYIAMNFLTTESITLEKFYLINIDKAQQRYSAMVTQLIDDKLPVKLERFSAVNGKDLQFTNQATGATFSGKDMLNLEIILNGDFNIACSSDEGDKINSLLIHYNQTEFKRRTPGEAGCFCSHYNIWHEIINKSYKNTFILEDDIEFVPYFSNILKIAIQNVPEDYDLLYLNYGPNPDSMAFHRTKDHSSWLNTILSTWDMYKNPFWKRVRRATASSRGYIISNKGSDKLLKCANQYEVSKYLPVDMLIQQCIDDGYIIAYASKPLLIKGSEKIQSQIDDMNILP